MKLSELMEFVDEIKPNAFPRSVKTAWVNEVEGYVQTDIMLLDPSDIVQYSYSEDAETELLVGVPHTKIYWTYLTALIDYANGEYAKYQNAITLYNAFIGEYTRWYAQRYQPANGGAEYNGYYISAYGIAVKHGYTGTETEWLASLKGADGADGIDGVDGADGSGGAVTATLPAASWANGSQTVNVAGVTADNTVLILRNAAYDAYIAGVSQGAGTLTFSCSAVPSADIEVDVIIMEDA